MRLFPLLSVCAAAVIAGAWAQAPGDEDASCLATAVASAEDVEVLMDSLNYRVLIPSQQLSGSPAWTQYNADGDSSEVRGDAATIPIQASKCA